MFWALVWWAIALVVAVVVFFLLSLLIADDPAAGLIFGAVAFILAGALMVRFGPGPGPSQEVWHDPETALPSMTHLARRRPPLPRWRKRRWPARPSRWRRSHTSRRLPRRWRGRLSMSRRRAGQRDPRARAPAARIAQIDRARAATRRPRWCRRSR